RENCLWRRGAMGCVGGIHPRQYDYRRACVPWLEKFFRHGTRIFLIPTRPSADYWHEIIFPNAELLLFTNGKIKFVRPDGSIGEQPGFGNTLIGMGEVACNALLRSKLGFCCTIKRVTTRSACRYFKRKDRSHDGF